MADKFYNQKDADKKDSKRGSYKGKKRGKSQRRGSSNYQKPMPEAENMSPINDIAWYSKYPALLQAAGSFPYPYRPGSYVSPGSIIYGDTTPVTLYTRMPGAMVLDWIPSIGRSLDSSSPASVLGAEMYARVRKAYTGTLRADAPDYVTYVMALDSIFSYIAWLKRLYRTVTAYSPNNYFIPTGLISAYGFTEATAVLAALQKDKVKLWGNINELILQAGKFTCPSSMDVMNRHFWMSDNVYTDAASINSQMYVFNLRGVYMYVSNANGSAEDPIPGLNIIPLPTGTEPSVLVDTLYNFGIQLINALVSWDDSYTINGYLMKAYDGDKMFSLTPLAQDELLAPVYEPEVLSQIENSQTAPGAYTIKTFEGFSVLQDVETNSVICQNSYQTISAEGLAQELGTANLLPMLSIRGDNPTVADNVIASRLKCQALTVTSSGIVTVSTGTEVPLAWYFISQSSDGKSFYRTYYKQRNLIDVYTDPTVVTLLDVVNQYWHIMRKSMFDWSPIGLTALLFKNEDGSLGRSWSWDGDVHNYTTIGVSDLEALHKVCLYSEFNAFGMS